MLKSAFFALVLLTSAAWLAAQTYPNQTGTSGGTQTSPSGTQTSTMGSQSSNSNPSDSQNTLQGCLSGSNGNFILTDNSGNTYQLTGDTDDLGKHVGQEVKVKGNSASSSASGTSGAGTAGATGAATGSGTATGTSPSAQGSISANTGTPGSSGTASVNSGIFNVSRVKKISNSCNSTGSK